MKNGDFLSDQEVAESKARRLEGMRLHEIEGNPLDREQVAMFEMFEREKWSHERRRRYMMDRVKRYRALTAAE
jgi:hypothetical protein